MVKHASRNRNGRNSGDELGGGKGLAKIFRHQFQDTATQLACFVHYFKSSSYQAMVCFRPVCSVNCGFHFSRSRASLALRNCSRISLVASLRTTGFKVEFMAPRICSNKSSAVTGVSVEKLKAEPRSDASLVSASASSM